MFAGIGIQFATGYSVAFGIYQIGTLVKTGAVGVGFVPGLIAVAAMVLVVVGIAVKSRRDIDRAIEK